MKLEQYDQTQNRNVQMVRIPTSQPINALDTQARLFADKSREEIFIELVQINPAGEAYATSYAVKPADIKKAIELLENWTRR